MAERSMEADVNAVLDEIVEKLHWCREHVQERTAAETLRQVEARLGYLAQALNWDMDGETTRASVALRLARGYPRRVQPAFADPHDPSVWQDWWLTGH